MVFSISNIIFTNMVKSSYRVIAVMSGTSLDGIDIIYASYTYDNDWNFTIHHSETIKYSRTWKLTLSQLVNKTMEDLREIDHSYSRYLANVILEFIKSIKLNLLILLLLMAIPLCINLKTALHIK